MLVLAYQLYLDSLCSCGFPRFMAHDPLYLTEFQVASAHCFVCEKVESRDQEDDQPGDRTRIVTDLYEQFSPEALELDEISEV